jgi:hypothetical protein
LILVIVLKVGGVGCSRREAGKSQGAASEASQIEAKQTPQQKVRPEKTDETVDWITYVGSASRFSLPADCAKAMPNPAAVGSIRLGEVVRSLRAKESMASGTSRAAGFGFTERRILLSIIPPD